MKSILMLFMALSLLLSRGVSPIDAVEIIEFGSREDAQHLLQIDINPSVLVGYGEDENVVYVASNNADGYDFLERHDAGAMIGEPIGATVNAMMLAARDDGYAADGLEMAIRYWDEEEGDLGALVEITRQAAELCDFDVRVAVEEAREVVYSAENGVTEQPLPGADEQLCDVCNGEGWVVCENCKGAGEAIVIIQREIEVRNDYVCEICGGKGWIDDGKHGGERGNCDSCGGLEGKMPSGDFKDKAYDKVLVDEEVMRRCEQCDGSGTMECPACSGAGVIDEQ